MVAGASLFIVVQSELRPLTQEAPAWGQNLENQSKKLHAILTGILKLVFTKTCWENKLGKHVLKIESRQTVWKAGLGEHILEVPVWKIN